MNVLLSGNDRWTRTFYWKVDSLSPPNGRKLRQIEERIFRSQQGVILKELNNRKWKGTPEQNRAADLKVSYIVKMALDIN